MSEETAHRIIKKRILAAWIDIVLFLTPLSYFNHPAILIIFLLNYVLLPHLTGNTVGMFLMKIKIIEMTSNTRNLPKFLVLLRRTIYFYTLYPFENILTRGIVKINQAGQTNLDQKFNTTIVFAESVWDGNTKEHVYESYLHHVIFFAILFIYFAGLLSFELISNLIKQ